MGHTVHFLSEVPKYQKIDKLYSDYEQKLEAYRNRCKDEAIDLLREYFWSLWD
ncbi:hypothetical protein P261_02362 [Lachnospiraceae bacterium TWA4]|nr:hypothetical protein P261_02362 [Lachnospiraceae bacterium TWA4]